MVVLLRINGNIGAQGNILSDGKPISGIKNRLVPNDGAFADGQFSMASNFSPIVYHSCFIDLYVKYIQIEELPDAMGGNLPHLNIHIAAIALNQGRQFIPIVFMRMSLRTCISRG